jgi:hypothetical protein
MSEEDYFEDQAGRLFRVGVLAYGVLNAKDPNISALLGPGTAIPVTVNAYRGLGVRVGFYGQYQRLEESERDGLSLSWLPPDPAADDGDGQWELGEHPDPLRVDEDGDGEFDRDSVRRLGHMGVFALTTSLYYELTIPRSRLMRIFQPYVGIGLMQMWVYTWSDIQSAEVFLIDNPDNDVDDPDNVDPFSTQYVPGLDVFGGFHFNVGTSFRVSLELGYLRAEVKPAELRRATEGFDARHDGYMLSMFRFGGGFVARL